MPHWNLAPVALATLDVVARSVKRHSRHLARNQPMEIAAKWPRWTKAISLQWILAIGRAIDITFDTHLRDAEQAAVAMKRGGVGWYPGSHFIHLDSGPTRNWELDGADFMIVPLP